MAAGRPVALAAHLDRLAASVAEVFGAELPASLATELAAAAAGLELGRLRVEAIPTDGEIRCTVRAEAIDPRQLFPSRADGADLRSVRPPAWSGAHKWSDRSWLESLEEELGEIVPLILGPNEEVLEAGRANVFAVLAGTLVTPPTDGRILAGTARRAVLDLATELGIASAERRLTLPDLDRAEDVFLTSSARGIRPVRSIDGRPREGSSEIVERLARTLRERWLRGG